MKATSTPVVLLAAGAVLFVADLFLAKGLGVALVVMGLCAAAFTGSLITNMRLVKPQGSKATTTVTAVGCAALAGLLLSILGFAGIYFAYWYKSVGG
jgi:hypothetical protein